MILSTKVVRRCLDKRSSIIAAKRYAASSTHPDDKGIFCDSTQSERSWPLLRHI